MLLLLLLLLLLLRILVLLRGPVLRVNIYGRYPAVIGIDAPKMDLSIYTFIALQIVYRMRRFDGFAGLPMSLSKQKPMSKTKN